MEKTSKKSNSRLQLIIAIMITTALFLAELYVMINESNNVVLVVGIAVLILIAVYFVIDAVLDCVNEKHIAAREQYDNIYRSEKASYMLIKKNLEELSKQVKVIDKGTGTVEADFSEIIKSQKAIAKVAMNKNKDIQDRLFIELNNLEASLNDRIRGLSEKLSGFQEEIERLADHIAKINEEAILTASKNGQEQNEKVITSEEDFEELFIPEEFVEDIEEKIIPEESLSEEFSVDYLDMETVEEPEVDFGSIDIEELLVEEPSAEESEEDILSQLLAAEETPVEEEVDVLAELTKAVEEKPEPAPTPAPSDNGGKMDQDDIAALIASMTN